MSHPLFFILLLILSLLFMNSNGVDAVNDSSTVCPSHDCGGVTIRYPFWRVDDTTSNQYCGYPEFGLNCSDGKPLFTLPNDAYYVEDINYTDFTLTLTLVDIDHTNQACPRARHNVTLDTVPLAYSPLDLNLSFYFNCTSNPSYNYPLSPIGCLGFGGRQSYVAVEVNETEEFDWFGKCEEKVVVTVMEAAIEVNNLTGGFGGAMNKGFVLNWRIAEDCGPCEDSGGLCGHGNTPSKLCFCEDGTIGTNHCNGTLFCSAYES
ncbi:hypothetical protein L1049_028524 [Liquidambar formosana]|uniref:non-specific serine/threonine protein kinase n=1 Tax=Liquidambar formosana TaxID=63359 RepID=A0AAP0RKM4_LIQFO